MYLLKWRVHFPDDEDRILSQLSNFDAVGNEFEMEMEASDTFFGLPMAVKTLILRIIRESTRYTVSPYIETVTEHFSIFS